MPANEDTHRCGLTFLFPIHFKLVNAYLCFTISSILCLFVLDVHFSQENSYYNHAQYLIAAALSSNNSPLLLTEPLSVMRGWSYFKEPKEHSSLCVKTAEVLIFLITYNNKYLRQEHFKSLEEIKTKWHPCVCSQVEHL